MTTDPMKDVEDRKAQFDAGVMAIRVFKGALSESDDWWQAFMATTAYFVGLFKSSNDPPEEQDDSIT